MGEFVRELRFAVRSLRNQPGLSFIAVVALGLGIGFTAVMFSIVYGALYRGLPFPDGDRIHAVLGTNPQEGIEQTSVSIHDYTDWKEQQSSMEELAAFYSGTVNVTAGTEPERYDGAFMTASGFRVLGVQPFLGRAFTDEETRPGGPQLLILGHHVWRDRFGSDPGILGQGVKVNGEDATVIGVMPEGFRFPQLEDVWVPLRVDPLALPRGEGSYVTPFGKLKPGVTAEASTAEFSGIARRLAEAYPETNRGLDAVVKPYTKMAMGGDSEPILLSMLGTVLLVLIVACANVANLLLARAAGRTKELAIRTAMGASRSRVLIHLLAEASILAVAGAVVGAVVARVGLDLFTRVVEFTDPPFWMSFTVDGPILLFIVAVTLLAALVSGLIPGLKVSGSRTHELLKDESRGSSSLRIGRLSRFLVMGEVAMSVGLLVSAGLMVKGMIRLRTLDYGFDRQEVFTARLGLFPSEYPDVEDRRLFFQELLDGLQSQPEVVSATLTTTLPGLGSNTTRFAVMGEAYAEETDYPRTRTVSVTPGFFETFGVGPLQGRTFQRADDPSGQPVVVVNAGFVRRFFPGEDPLGRQVRLGTSQSEEPWLTIVGVVPDLYMQGVANSDEVTQGVYLPLAQNDAQFISLAVRGRGDPMALATVVREQVTAVSPDTPLYWVRTQERAIAEENWVVDIFGGLFGIFGVGALFLAAVGLYGVMAFSVKQRTQEVGIRMALGARAGRVLGMVLGHGIRQIAVGLVVGLGLGALLSRGLGEFLTLVDPWDPSVFGGIALVLLLTGLVASYVPAWRATRVSPVEALRER
jgi:putative ABC transport system permease protein